MHIVVSIIETKSKTPDFEVYVLISIVPKFLDSFDTNSCSISSSSRTRPIASKRTSWICSLSIFPFPPAIIRKRDRLAYIGALEKAQTGGLKTDYEKLIAKAAERSLDIYLKAVHGESSGDDGDTEELLKIGELASAAGVTVPTIRHWTKEGLLEVAEFTESGYQLYSADMKARCEEIQALQKQRLTLEEIKRQQQE